MDDGGFCAGGGLGPRRLTDRLRFGVALTGRGSIDLDEVTIVAVMGLPHDVPYAVQEPLERPVNLAIE